VVKTEKPRYTFQDFQKLCDEKNFNLISVEPTKNSEIVEFLCDKGHKNMCVVAYIDEIKPCRECYIKPPKTIDSVRKEFKQRDFTLLSTEYKNNTEKLKFHCSKGHENEMSYTNWRRSTGCVVCGEEQKKSKLKHDYNFVKGIFEEKNCVLLTTEYINNLQKLKYICPNNHAVETTFQSFYRSNNECIICLGKYVSDSEESAKELIRKNRLESVREMFKSEGYTLLSNEYINNLTKLEYKCPKGHINTTTADAYQSGARCPGCKPRSGGEYAIAVYLDNNKLNYVIEAKFSNCINIKELPFDFYVNNDFLIEFDGSQHFEINNFFGGEKNFIYTQNNDIIKTKYCIINKIPLLRISHKEIKQIPQIIETFMKDISIRDKTKPFVHFSNQKLYEYLIKVYNDLTI
jgi:transcription initiation factor IIE alpha subunit